MRQNPSGFLQMPFFSFEATDTQGRRRQGQIQGTTPDQVRQLLTGQGLQNVQIRIAAAPAAAPTPKPAAAQPVKSVPVSVPAPTLPAEPKEHKPTRLSDKDRMFFFGQLGRFYHSGIAPNKALEELADRARSPGQQETFREIARLTGGGTGLGAAMRQYPDYFSPDDAATMEAGEKSGELTAACDAIAQQADKSHRLKKQLRWYTLTLTVTAGLFPILLGIVNGSLASMKVQDAAGGSLPVVATAAKYTGQGISSMLPALAAGITAFFLLRWIWQRDRFLMLRHRLVLAIPLVNGRARAESLLRLAFSLQNLAKAGLAPKTSFDIAADSMPNRELARRAREAAAQMRENQSLSDALRSAGLFDPQMNDVVSTGEITGDVPRAMAQVASAQAGDYDARDTNFSHLSCVLLYIPLAIMVVTMLAILYLTLYSGIIRQLTTD